MSKDMINITLPDGTVLEKPLLEFCYKNDSLGDPLIAQEHIYTFNYCDITTLNFITKK